MQLRNLLRAVALLAVFSLSSTSIAKDWGSKESYAVVNPVVRSEYAKVMSLSGDWDFTYGPDVENYRLRVGGGAWGLNGVWGPDDYDWANVRKIKVPGVWEAQGVGEPGPCRTWDCIWDCGIWDLRSVYAGSALYHKTVDVPKDWANGRVWLKVGGVGSQAHIWVNGGRAAFVKSYCGARKYDVTALIKPGETNEIVAMVRNDVPSRLGDLGINEHFGGFYRDVELESTPALYVDDVWARGDVASKSADIRVYVKSTDADGNAFPIYEDELSANDRDRLQTWRESGLAPESVAGGKRTIEGLGSVEATIKTLDGKVVGSQSLTGETTNSANGLANAFRFSIPIENCQLWTPEKPNLYLAEIAIKDADGKVVHGWTERFGVRELKVVGRQFLLNGTPYFFRGSGDDNADQINLIEPPDRDVFRGRLQLYKSAGFNYMRFHTHCPLPEYFEIADEKGILLQPELPYYHDVPTEGFEFDPKRDMYELFRTNRRYVSFATYSYGNEGWLGSPVDVELYQWVKKYDPDRLVIHQDGGPANRPDDSDFTTSGASGGSLINPWPVGANDSVDRPFVAHEYLNLSIKMDPRLESRFTGVRLAPISVAKWKERLESVGLDENWGAKCVAASEKLQAIYQKQGLEAARLDPACDGYMFWSLVDMSIPQGISVAAQGYLNAFWELRENGNSPEVFNRFNGPTALLISTDQPAPIIVNGDKFNVEFKISHYNAEPTPAGYLEWKLVAKTGGVLAQGSVPIDAIPAGFAGKIGECAIEAPEDMVAAPTAAEFVVSIPGTDVVNSWEYWVFPKRAKRSLKGFAVSASWFDEFAKLYDDVKPIAEDSLKGTSASDDDIWIVAPTDVEYGRALEQGRRVFALARASSQPNVSLGWWTLGAQVGASFDVDSPAFAGFPNSADMDELWFRLVRTGAPDLADKPLGDRFEPLAIGEGSDSYYLHLGQTKFGSAKILACWALDLTQDAPEATALLDSLLDYVSSDAFDPQTSTTGLVASSNVVPTGVVWGFDRLVEATNEIQSGPTLYEDSAVNMSCPQRSKTSKLVWQTTKRETSGDASTTFMFTGGLGYWSQPATDGFVMTVDGAEPIAFDLPEKDAKVGDKVEWKSEDGSSVLAFEVVRKDAPGPDFFGVFTLTVPTSALDANAEKSTISVRSLGDGSLRWFDVYEYAGLRESRLLESAR